ncbi:gamma-glutamyltransferase family protein [Serratia sp. AKBS12]|uniref:gamma-glutamyltransferase family protein n=1 Tax=Serratia sp. AKBS12 TaxID=2974597 RepID=UPI0021660006|nr:gamma-glutamyltransferase family protein [Serratia sp. AKBS12]MCS3409922.1 gamma-glutamyltransferase family protein [Serratia sp. AKBS12]HEI8867270.1 gamma-glutamyltransferase family protein [Serratia odorifera]
MINSNSAPLGMAVTPHHLASESALAVLRKGGNAIEAMVAAAATIAVAYPHMNGLGGDGFWLIVPPQGDPLAIDASGAAGSLATLALYAGESRIPHRGPKAALTVAGTVGGWQEALSYAAELGGKPLPLSSLLADAIRYAADGIPVTASQEAATRSKHHELAALEHFARVYLPRGEIPRCGQRFCQPKLAETLITLAEQGLDSFYRGELAQRMAADMAQLGMPLTAQDLATYRPRRRTPLRLAHQQGEVFNLTPPTQGLVSLAILGLADRLPLARQSEGATVHAIVEATKLAFGLRDCHITDPAHMTQDPQALLAADSLDRLARQIDGERAAEWGNGKGPGDTVWMGVMDSSGLAVSFIQSIYHEFGSGVVLPDSGILWQNRGASFSLDAGHLLALAPGKQPFHTLNPAAARLYDGRTLVYGAMGGDGQPQTQAAVFIRHVVQGLPLQQAISAPRWLLGRTWGDSSDSLKLESRFGTETIDYLRQRGHQVELLPDFSEAVGHAGAIVRHTNGMLEGAFDPRSNGSAAGF